MLVSLHIRDFAIIDELEVELHHGMTALTGETGAGKSILLGALGLLLGDRADAGAVRHGAERADLSASFDISKLARVRDWLQEQSLELDDECQLRRVIAREGRSRAYINGTSVPLQLLRELGEHLVDIHGQHEHQSLMKRDLQRQLLDRHGRHATTLAKLASLHNDWKRVQQDIETILGSGNDRDSRLEFLRFQLQELDELAPQPGEVEALHKELARLSSAGQLLETCASHTETLYDDDRSAHSLLGQAINDLAPLTAIDPSLKDASELFNNALIQLEEGVGLLRDYRDRVELDPRRQQEVEQRIEGLHKVAAKHHIEPETLPGFHQQLAEQLQQLEQADQRLDALELQRAALQDDYRKTAEKLHKQRLKTARQLSKQVSEAMQTLGMSGGKLEIEISKTDPDKLSPLGTDQVEFRVSANPGQPPAPLAKVASGGELSRISLAIQVIATEASDIPSLIFDEVDSGVGGAVADTVGQQLRSLGEHRQVLCVTHLPQVASQAHHHLQVSKLTGDQTTRTRISTLDEEERVEEIARMLGGQKITKATLDHARDMLDPSPSLRA